MVNALKSPHTVIPYEYYHDKFAFCRPDETEGVKSDSSSLGSVLFGDRVFNSPFKLFMQQNTTCVSLCTQKLTKANVNFISQRIEERYYYNWSVSTPRFFYSLFHFIDNPFFFFLFFFSWQARGQPACSPQGQGWQHRVLQRGLRPRHPLSKKGSFFLFSFSFFFSFFIFPHLAGQPQGCPPSPEQPLCYHR